MNKVKKWILIILGVLIVAWLMWYFSKIVIYILIAAVISILGEPLMHLLGKLKIGKIKLPHTLNAVISLLSIYAVFFGFFVIVVPVLFRQFNSLGGLNAETLTGYFREPLASLNNFLIGNSIIDANTSIEAMISTKIMSILNVGNFSLMANSALNMATSFIAAVFIIGFIAFFFLKEKRMFLKGILMFTPVKYQSEIKHIYYKIIQMLSRYFVGLLLDIFLVITIITLTTWLFGFKNALMIGFFAGIMNVVPYIGPFIGWIFAMIFAITGTLEAGQNLELATITFKITGILICVNFLDAFLLQPTIYANVVKAHPLEIFLVILLAGTLAGIPGMILAIPTYTVLRIIAKEFLSQYQVVSRITKNI
jgi:predicted PurR-regulated permease PerM